MSRDERLAAWRRGRDAEGWVADHLVADGWTVLARNWLGESGELDLVVERDGVLRFVEIKARAPDDPSGLDALGESKRRHLRHAGEEWLAQRGPPAREVAFLVVVVTTGADGWTAEWLDDAF